MQNCIHDNDYDKLDFYAQDFFCKYYMKNFDTEC